MATHLHSDLSKVGFHDKSVTKVTERSAPHGELGQKYLAAGIKLGKRTNESRLKRITDMHRRNAPLGRKGAS